jgi:hypothetical protein
MQEGFSVSSRFYTDDKQKEVTMPVTEPTSTPTRIYN